MAKLNFKSLIAAPIRVVLGATAKVREPLVRIYSFASLASQIRNPLPSSTVVLGRNWVYGTGEICFGEGAFLYPHLYLETRDSAKIVLGDGVVLSRGVHLVAMAGITIGEGTMIGEYTSIRDANHARRDGVSIRDAGHSARPVVIGNEVWVGRGVTIVGGVTIGDHATVGANAVVTKDVPAGAVVAGVPATAIRSRMSVRDPVTESA